MALDPSLAALRPYPELDPELERLVQFVYERPWPVDEATIRFETRWNDQLLARAERTRLLKRDGVGWRPSALALLYLDDVPQARRDLAALEALATLARTAYRPGAADIEEPALCEALELDPVGLRRLSPLANDLGLPLFMGSNGRWFLPLRESAARHPGLPALLAAALRNAGDWWDDPTRPPRPGSYALRLTRLRASGFRALRDFDLRLPTPLTVLVGPNSVGKSTTLDLVAFLAAAATAGLRAALAHESGLERLRTRGVSGPVEVEAGFEYSPGFEPEAGQYGFTVGELHGEPLVEEERLIVAGDAEFPWLEGRRGVVRLRLPDDTVERRYRGTGTLTLPTLDDEARYPVAVNVRRDLASVVLIDRDPLLQSVEGRGARRRHTTNVATLLASVAASAERTQALGETLRALAPSVRGVGRLALTGEVPELEVEEADLPGASRFDELSAGMRQLVLLAALYVQPEPPRTILLEEPDAGLHAGALPALRDLLRSLSERSTVIATSHSPAFVGLLDPEREVVALEREGERVRARPLAEALQAQRWLDAFGATGEAFLRSGLEHEP